MSSSPGSLSQSLFDGKMKMELIKFYNFVVNQCLVNSDEPFLLNSSLSFSDHEINTSRILSLK